MALVNTAIPLSMLHKKKKQLNNIVIQSREQKSSFADIHILYEEKKTKFSLPSINYRIKNRSSFFHRVTSFSNT
jgi:hypothetical protein